MVCAVTTEETALPNSASKFCVVILVSESESALGLMTMMPRIGILIVGAVELVGDAGEGLAVDHDLLGALRVLIGGVVPAEFLGAGQQQLQIGEVAVGNRQIDDLLGVEDGGDIGAIDLEQGDLTRR